MTLLIFLFLFYKLGDSLATSLSTAFDLDIGFSKTEIGLISKTSSPLGNYCRRYPGRHLAHANGYSKALVDFCVA